MTDDDPRLKLPRSGWRTNGSDQREAGPAPSRRPTLTFRTYALGWLKEHGPRSRQSYESIVRTYLVPRFGELELQAITSKSCKAFVAELRTRKGRRGRPLAARTIRNIVGRLHTIFEDAVDEELIDANPCRMRRSRHLPKAVDANPAWRANAIYRRRELVQLITDRRLPELKRIATAIHALTGPRSGELAALTWDAYEPDFEPLGRLVFAWTYSTTDKEIRRTKTDLPHIAPVHPLLAVLLERWFRAGWRDTFGRDPRPSDLIIPTSIHPPTPMRNDGLYQRLESACRKLGIRFRGPHCLRATFLSLAQEDGANREIIQTITHPKPGDVVAGYSRFPYDVVCREVAKLRLELNPRSSGSKGHA